jgi:hypothetical protein
MQNNDPFNDSSTPTSTTTTTSTSTPTTASIRSTQSESPALQSVRKIIQILTRYNADYELRDRDFLFPSAYVTKDELKKILDPDDR